jgi:hypothetical protein
MILSFETCEDLTDRKWAMNTKCASMVIDNQSANALLSRLADTI